jgi:3-methyladenine DNA glycosylase AlkD
MTHANTVRQFFIDNATTNASKQPDGYTGSTSKAYGIRAPQMREFVKAWVSEHKDLPYGDWLTLLNDLYHGDSQEEHIVTSMFLERYKQHRRRLPLSQLDSWLSCLVGWAEVDSTCAMCFTAADVLERWDEWVPFLRRLSEDTNINKRRASIVLLLKPVRESTDARLLNLALENVERLKSEKDMLITKAVSWILREATKQHHAAIEKYVKENAASLPAIAVRETRKKLTTGKK